MLALTLVLLLLIVYMIRQDALERFGPEISGTSLWGAVHSGRTVLGGAVYADPVINPL